MPRDLPTRLARLKALASHPTTPPTEAALAQSLLNRLQTPLGRTPVSPTHDAAFLRPEPTVGNHGPFKRGSDTHKTRPDSVAWFGPLFPAEGHVLHSRGIPLLQDRATRTELALDSRRYCPAWIHYPRDPESIRDSVQGLARLTHLWTTLGDPVSILCWWDRTVDSRQGSRAVLVAHGHYSASAMLSRARLDWSQRMETCESTYKIVVADFSIYDRQGNRSLFPALS